MADRIRKRSPGVIPEPRELGAHAVLPLARHSPRMLVCVVMWERMGSGGLRGLQIPRSGVKSARGGFDSHAFPPFVTLALAAASLLAAPEGASARVATIGGPLDSSATQEPGAAGALHAPGFFAQPRGVMLRSLVLPGWGQYYNHAWIKAALVAGTEGTLGVELFGDERALSRYQGQADRAARAGDQAGYALAVSAYNSRLNRLVSREWLLGGVLAYALVDAYVDAHFRSFDFEFSHDPALPGGKPPASKLRIAWRWSF